MQALPMNMAPPNAQTSKASGVLGIQEVVQLHISLLAQDSVQQPGRRQHHLEAQTRISQMRRDVGGAASNTALLTLSSERHPSRGPCKKNPAMRDQRLLD